MRAGREGVVRTYTGARVLTHRNGRVCPSLSHIHPHSLTHVQSMSTHALPMHPPTPFTSLPSRKPNAVFLAHP